MKLLTGKNQLIGRTIHDVQSICWENEDNGDITEALALTFADSCCVFDAEFNRGTRVKLLSRYHMSDEHLLALGLETTESLSRRQAREILAQVTDDGVKDALRDLLSEE